MPDLRADTTRFTLKIESLEDEIHVVGLRGVEQLSSPYRFDLELACENHEIDFASIVNQPALLVIDGNDEPRYLQAMVNRFEQGDQGVRFTTYYATLVPRLWYLAHRHNCRIFQEMDVQQIIEQILKDAGFSSDDYRFELKPGYAKREYCVQYRESELNFISRLMEEEGICYFFEDTGDSHVLVMADAISAFKSIAGNDTVIFHTPTGMAKTEEHVYRYRYAEEVRPGAVRYRDYNFKKPDLNLQSEFEAEVDTNLEVYDYPGNYTVPELGKTRAQVRLEELQAVRKTGNGESDCVRLLPGFQFTLDEHVRDQFNQKYLITEIRQTGRQPQVLGEGASTEGSSYANAFVCIPADVPYRPARITRKPVVDGAQTAIVVGPKGEEIYTDEHGRVKVQFHWDREGEANEKSSCWIRTSSAWAGAGWGAISIPRIGHEVIVDFLEGDPDRPIITGRVYHGTNRPPYALPDEKTKSTLKSNSSKGGKGFNEIRLEDKKGEEQIFVHAEKNQDIRVKNNAFEWIGNDRHLIVKNDQFEKVEANQHLTTLGDRFQQVDGDENMKVSGDQLEAVAGSQHLSVSGDQMIKVTGNQNVSVTGNQNEETSQKRSIKAGMDIHEKAGMNFAVDAGMGVHIKGGMNVVIEAGMMITLKAGGGFITVGPTGVAISGTPILINSGGAAGAGSGSSPSAPAAAETPAAPEEAVEADNGKPGKVATTKSRAKPRKPSTYSPAAVVLQQAAKDGTPFCEQCEKAARERDEAAGQEAS